MGRGQGGSLTAVVVSLCVGIALGFALGRAWPAGGERAASTPPAASAPRTDGGSGPPAAPAPTSAQPWYGRPKPEPRWTTFQGCPPEGDGGDPALNRVKNRVDEPTEPVALPLDSLVALPWPEAVGRRDRRNWSRRDLAAVQRFEGTPVVVEAYVAAARTAGPESANCHGADAEMRDWHIWLTREPTEERANSLVAEPTPYFRDRYPAWTLPVLRQAAREDRRVRVTGWLMLDAEHPEQLGRTRGTLWEIHPITRIEVQQDGRWVELDQLEEPQPRRRRA